MEAIAELDEFDMSCFTPMLCDLNDFACVRQFCEDVKVFANEKPVDRLVCNAALYQPSLDVPKWSKDGIEQQMQSNFLSHFLMISLLMPFMKGTAGTTPPPSLRPLTLYTSHSFVIPHDVHCYLPCRRLKPQSMQKRKSHLYFVCVHA
jgi:NAD(P)-dependent dehydrogenase (short-subunit alcohol dehydrogenase family)